jgi:hypothetical protein
MLKYNFLLLLLLVGVTGLSAQITLTADNYGSQDTVILLDTFYADSTPFINPPQGGADQVWDYSDRTLELVGANENFPIGEDTCFAGATSFSFSNTSFQGFVYPLKSYETTNASGRIIIGQKLEEQKFSLLQVTGNPADTLTFLEDAPEVNFPFIRFPATFGSSFVDTTSGASPFALTVAAFGLNNTPGAEQSITVKHLDVIGYGTVILPQSDGSVTEPLEVLLIRDSTVVTETYTLGGAPAPAALLQAFGLMDVNVTSRVSYFFQAKGRGRSVARFSEGSFDGEITFRFDVRDVAPGTTTATRRPEVIKLTLFPNPVRPGDNIRLSGRTDLIGGTARLLDLQGRVITEQVFNGFSGEAVELFVPATTKPGLYFYQLLSQNGQPVGLGKVMVR